MTKLTVTARGQVTLRKEGLHPPVIRPGDNIASDMLPNGRAVLGAAAPAGTIDAFRGLLAGKTGKVASPNEMNEAAASGWAGPSHVPRAR